MLVILYGPVLVDSLYLIPYTIIISLGGFHEIVMLVIAALISIKPDITPGSVKFNVKLINVSSFYLRGVNCISCLAGPVIS